MCGPLLLLALALPGLEIFCIIRVGQAIGALETMVLLTSAFLLGVGFVRGHGFVALRRLQAGAPPGPDVLAGPLTFLGALLLMIPGFVTDAFALPLLFPPTRRLVAWAVIRYFGRRRGPGRGSDVVVITARRD